ncbi:hypothetical protein R3P38DRAFT_2762288 [Favolaschia claudopus]|uniref:Uncharacterized protein n=1 Tax=Favolaschia claudopus TaxID=2862362 RepID=A0AAW0DIN1_9AGAR
MPKPPPMKPGLQDFAAGRLIPPPTRQIACPANVARRLGCWRRGRRRRPAAQRRYRVDTTITTSRERNCVKVLAAGRLAPPPDAYRSESHRILGRRQANSAPDAYSSGFPDWFARSSLPFVAAARSGAIPLTRRIAVRRAAFLILYLRQDVASAARRLSSTRPPKFKIQFLSVHQATLLNSRQTAVFKIRDSAFPRAAIWDNQIFSFAARPQPQPNPFKESTSPRSQRKFSSLRGSPFILPPIWNRDFKFHGFHAEFKFTRRSVRTRTLETSRETGFSRV